MTTMTRKSRKSETPKFENRVRFNWGFHDAALAVKEGWDNVENNFGFAHHGPLAGLQNAWDVPAKHFDATYARGWFIGWCTATQGESTESSQRAWDSAIAGGMVSE